MISEFDIKLVELLSNYVENMCGSTDKNLTFAFIKNNSKFLLLGETKEFVSHPQVKRTITQKKTNFFNINQRYHNKQIYSFFYEGREYYVNKWQELLLQLCQILHAKDSRLFEQSVLSLSGSKRLLFSKQEN